MAVQKLSPGQRAVLDHLWEEARTGHEKRLCGQAADAAQAEKPSCIDWAAWPAISGDLFRDVIQDVPVPGLGPGAGSLPRFRAEMGPFLGISAAAYAKGVNGGFGKKQTTPGAIGGLEAAVRFGLGLEGVMNEAGDGLVFLDLGMRLDSASTMKITDAPAVAQYGAIGSAIPSRNAYTARLRMPFWLVPGDLLLALPVLAISPDTYAKMAVEAANGGLIPWQSGIATPVGRF